MTIILITLLTTVCVLFVVLRVLSIHLDNAKHIIERRDAEIDQLQKRIYELTGMIQQAQRYINEK